jgi:hypothetical protein
MSSKVYGTSDDLIEVEGDVKGEAGCYGTDDREHGVLVIFSDGTLLELKYGKSDMAIWGINIIKEGALFSKIEICNDEDARPYSDIVYFEDGLKWAFAATEWEKVT